MSIFDRILPDGEDPESLRKWRLSHSLMDLVSLAAIVLIVIPAMFVGLPMVGQLAWADSTDTKIERAVAPIRQDIENIKKKDIQEIKDATADIKVALLVSSILNARRQQCDAILLKQPARYWSDRLIDLKADYKKLTTEQFDMPTCEEI